YKLESVIKMEKKPIIIDTDPGIDDAVALAIALHSEKLDVRQITTVHGNVRLDKTTVNALKLLDFFNKEVAVSAGATRPLLRESINASQVHGESGLDGFTFPEPDQHLLTKEHAVNVMHREIMESKEKITLVPIGPLTNIALLIRTFPEVCHHIEEIVLMGCSAGSGNVSSIAKVYIFDDLEVSKIVFGSDITIVMIGLDIGIRVSIFTEDVLRIKGMKVTSYMVYHLLTHYHGDVIASG